MTDNQTDGDQTPLEELTVLLKGQRARWRRWFAGMFVLLLAIGANQVRIQHVANEAKAAAATAQTAATKAQQAIDQILAQRTEARVNTCRFNKTFADAHNGLILYLASVPPDKNDTRTPAQRAALIRDFKMKNLVPTPDCTPEGIAAFYAGQGGTKAPDVPATPATTTTPSAVKATKHATTTTRPAPTTSRPTTTTTVRRPPATTTTACAGPSIPVQGVPCL